MLHLFPDRRDLEVRALSRRLTQVFGCHRELAPHHGTISVVLLLDAGEECTLMCHSPLVISLSRGVNLVLHHLRCFVFRRRGEHHFGVVTKKLYDLDLIPLH